MSAQKKSEKSLDLKRSTIKSFTIATRVRTGASCRGSCEGCSDLTCGAGLSHSAPQTGCRMSICVAPSR